MPFNYQLWLRRSAYDYLETLNTADHQRLLDWIEHLGRHPFRDGDFVQRGDDGRDWQVAVVATHAVAWWVDDAVCEVKVANIRPADR